MFCGECIFSIWLELDSRRPAAANDTVFEGTLPDLLNS